MKPLWITIEPSKPRQIIIQLLILFYSNGAYDFPPTGMIIKASNVPPNYNFICIYIYICSVNPIQIWKHWYKLLFEKDFNLIS